MTPTEVHNNMKLEMFVIEYLLKKNKEKRENNPKINIPLGTRVKVYNQPNSFGKRIRISKPDPYEVIHRNNNIYTIRNLTTNEIDKAPRIWLDYL